MARRPFTRRGQDPGLVHGFRSGLEAANSRHLAALGAPVLFETFKVKYVVPETMRNYTPDFLLPNGIIVETKGIFDAADRAKHVLVKAEYPELDIRFVFTRSKAPIYKGSPTTLGMWATANGFKWAEKLIPEAWLKEPGPKVHPFEVLKAGPQYPARKTPTPKK